MSKTIFINFAALANENGKPVVIGEWSALYDVEKVKELCPEENVFKTILDNIHNAAVPEMKYVARNIQILEL